MLYGMDRARGRDLFQTYLVALGFDLMAQGAHELSIELAVALKGAAHRVYLHRLGVVYVAAAAVAFLSSSH